jgi:hypothetical protein
VQGRACAAEVRFDLRPGFHEYQRVRARDLTEKVFLKTLRADNVKCWIGDYLVS